MATGDYHHTALAVARGVGMVPLEGQIIIIQKTSEAQDLRVADSQDRPCRQDLLAGTQLLDTSSAPAGPLQRTASAVSFAPEPRAQAESSDSAHQGLVFQTDNGSSAEEDGLQALSLIAQVCFKSHKCFNMCFHYLMVSRTASSW